MAGCLPASAAYFGLSVPCSQLSAAVKANRWLLLAESLSRLGLAALSLIRFSPPSVLQYTPSADFHALRILLPSSFPHPTPYPGLTHSLTEPIEGDILEGWCLTGLQDVVGLLQGWLSHNQRRRLRSSKSSAHKAGCFSSFKVVSKAWRIPGELLIFSPHWKAEEAPSNIRKGISSSHRDNKIPSCRKQVDPCVCR